MKRQEPFNVLRDRNKWEHSPRSEAIVAVIAPILAAQAAAGTVTLAYTALVTAVSVGLSAVTSWAVAALTPAPPTPRQSLLVNSRDAAAPQEIVYGEVRKGGPITYLETIRGGSILYMIIPLAAHEIESVEEIYINDEVAVLSDDSYTNSRGRTGAGWVTNRNWSDDPDEHEMRIFYHLGDQTAITDTFANSSVASMDNIFLVNSANFNATGQPDSGTFVGNGIAFLFVQFSYAASVYKNGLPTITAKIRGKKVFDPRTSTTAYSNNAALCIRDYLTSTYGLSDPEVDDTVFQATANTSDEAVTLAAGGTEPRYTINGVVKADQSYGDVLQEMVTACAGTLFWGAGKWKLKVGEYNAPTKVLTLDDLRSSINLQTRTNLRDQFNRVQGVFTDAEQRYIPADYPPVISDGTGSFTEEDGGVEQALDLDLPFTTSSAAAQRIAKLTLFRGREQMVFSADFGLNAFDVEVGEIIALTIDRYGWDEKEFEVLSWNFGTDGEGGALRVTMTLRETSAAAFSWAAEEAEIISNNTSLEPDIAVVDNLTATAGGVINSDSTFLNAIEIAWDFVDGATSYSVEWRENTVDYSSGRVEEADAITAREQFIYKGYVEILNRQPAQGGFDFYNTGAGSTLTEAEFREELLGSAERASNSFGGVSVSTKTNAHTIIPVKDNTLYDIRVRADSAVGRDGTWTATTFSTAKDATVPAAPTGLAASAGYGGNEITWNEVTANADASALNDLFLYEVYRGTATAPTTLVGRVTGESFSDTGLDNATEYFYRVKARDFSGNVSAYSTEVSVTTKDLNDAVTAELSATSAVVSADSDGSNPALPTGTTMFVFIRGTDDSANWTFARVNGTGVTSTLGGTNGNVLSVTALANDTGFVDITASKVGLSDITKRFTLAKAKQGVVGDPGDPGDPGADGTDGKDAIKVIVENPVAIVKNTNDGGSSADDYTGTGSIVRVFEGDTELVYDSTPVAGQWEITSITDVGVTAGTVTDSGTFATVGNSSSLIGDVPRQITYNISGRRLDNTLFSTEGYQVVRRVRDGVQPITVLLDNSPTAVPVNAAGTVDYSGTGPGVRVFEGSTELTYDSTPTNGQWEFDGLPTVTSGTITVGTLNGLTGAIADHSNMTTDKATIRYDVTGDRLNGDVFTASITQTLTKVFDGAVGDQGDTGDTVVSGVVYFQTLQGTAPATPSATSYNTSTGEFTGLTAGWATTQPPVEITDTTVQEWKSVFTVTIDGVTGVQARNFSTPTGAIQVTADIESDNYVTGTSGWQIQRDTGNAEFNDVTIRGTAESSNYVANTTGWQINDDGTAEFNNIDIRDTLQSPNYVLNTSGWQVNSDGSAEFNDVVIRGELDAANVTVTGTFNANIIKIDGTTLQYDVGTGDIIVKDGGVGTDQIAAGAVVDQYVDEAGATSRVAITANNTFVDILEVSFTDDGVGFVDVWWGVTLEADSSSGSDAFAFFELEVVYGFAGTGYSVTRTYAGYNVPVDTQQTVSFKYPFSLTTGRGAGTATITVKVKQIDDVNAPSGYYKFGMLSVMQIKR